MTSFVITIPDEKLQEFQKLQMKLGLPTVGMAIDLSLALLLWANEQDEAGRHIASMDIATDTYRRLRLCEMGNGTELLFAEPSAPIAKQTFEPEQEARLSAWLTLHDKACPYRDNQGATGGRLTRHSTPTGLGSVEKVSCACGAQIDLTDYESW